MCKKDQRGQIEGYEIKIEGYEITLEVYGEETDECLYIPKSSVSKYLFLNRFRDL